MNATGEIIAYARTYLGVHYRWGGNTRFGGMDCSGFLCDVLRRSGIIPLKNDYSCQSLYDHLKSIGAQEVNSSILPGAIIFFGSSRRDLTHVGLAVSRTHMIESGGGGSRTLTLEDAIRDNAGVRESLISSRRDRVDALLPKYV